MLWKAIAPDCISLSNCKGTWECHSSSRFILSQKCVYMENWQLKALLTKVICDEFYYNYVENDKNLTLGVCDKSLAFEDGCCRLNVANFVA